MLLFRGLKVENWSRVLHPTHSVTSKGTHCACCGQAKQVASQRALASAACLALALGQQYSCTISRAPGPAELEGQNPSHMEGACFNLGFGGERRGGRLTASFFVGKQETSIPKVHKPSQCCKYGTNYQGYLVFAVIFTEPCDELHKTSQGATAAPVMR